jgi:deazaflavin-dependent oxidoreductase (nitroreductase family)
MPGPRWLARFNRRVTNVVARRVAAWAPGFGIVVHRGRRSGRVYRTPVNVFRRGDGYVFALTYGPEADWVRNVLAAGGCELRTGGRRVRLTEPRLVHDAGRRGMPGPVRVILGLVGVTEFLVLRVAAALGD